MKRLAVVLIGWHYPSQPYEKLINQTLPEGWEADFFVVGHRDPIHSHNEKDFNLNPQGLLDKLNLTMYKTPITIEYLNKLGWEYIQGKSGNEWEGANRFLSKHNYKDYDCLLFAGDDMLIINDNLFTDVLSNDLEIFSNQKQNNKWVSKKDTISYVDWLVISNTIHNGRQAIRGSFEFFKSEIFDLLGGEFPLHTRLKDLSKKLNSNTKTPNNPHATLNDYNTQYWLFMEIINNNNLYNKIKFLSKDYRVSRYIIEAERGLLTNNNTPYASIYQNKINDLNHILNKFTK